MAMPRPQFSHWGPQLPGANLAEDPPRPTPTPRLRDLCCWGRSGDQPPPHPHFAVDSPAWGSGSPSGDSRALRTGRAEGPRAAGSRAGPRDPAFGMARGRGPVSHPPAPASGLPGHMFFMPVTCRTLSTAPTAGGPLWQLDSPRTCGVVSCLNATPRFLQRPGFWASSVPGDLELICLLDSFPGCSLPAKRFCRMAHQDGFIQPFPWVLMLIL